MQNNDFVQKLSDILVKQESVSQKESDAMKEDFYKRSKEAFDFFLIDEGIVSKDKVLKALSEYYQVPAVDIVGLFFDHDLVRSFPKEFLLENAVVPLEVDQDILVVVANNPSDPELLDKIADFVTYTVEFQVGLKQDIFDTIREFYNEPPGGYIADTTDEDEVEDSELDEGVEMDDLADNERW